MMSNTGKVDETCVAKLKEWKTENLGGFQKPKLSIVSIKKNYSVKSREILK